jgi:hypothetical protein
MARVETVGELSKIVEETNQLQSIADALTKVHKEAAADKWHLKKTKISVNINTKTGIMLLEVELNRSQDPINLAFLQDFARLLNMTVSTRKLTYDLPFGA